MNIKKLSYESAYDIINNWLTDCDNVRKLDFKPDYYIRYNLNLASRKGYLPIGFRKFKIENRKLYSLLQCKLNC